MLMTSCWWQLLTTGTEGETISSSPNLPGISPPAEEVHLKFSNSCLNTHHDLTDSDVQVYSNKAMDSSYHDNDRCPTPPLPLPRPTSVTERVHHHRCHTLNTTYHKSPRRPPAWRLAQEDARSTPPISPFSSDLARVVDSFPQETLSPADQTGASTSNGQVADRVEAYKWLIILSVIAE